MADRENVREQLNKKDIFKRLFTEILQGLRKHIKKNQEDLLKEFKNFKKDRRRKKAQERGKKMT